MILNQLFETPLPIDFNINTFPKLNKGAPFVVFDEADGAIIATANTQIEANDKAAESAQQSGHRVSVVSRETKQRVFSIKGEEANNYFARDNNPLAESFLPDGYDAYEHVKNNYPKDIPPGLQFIINKVHPRGAVEATFIGGVEDGNEDYERWIDQPDSTRKPQVRHDSNYKWPKSWVDESSELEEGGMANLFSKGVKRGLDEAKVEDMKEISIDDFIITANGDTATIASKEPRGQAVAAIKNAAYEARKKRGVVAVLTQAGKDLKDPNVMLKFMATKFTIKTSGDALQIATELVTNSAEEINVRIRHRQKSKAEAPARNAAASKHSAARKKASDAEIAAKLGLTPKDIKRVTYGQVGGDDGYQYNVFIDRKSIVSGLTLSEVPHYKMIAYKMIAKQNGTYTESVNSNSGWFIVMNGEIMDGPFASKQEATNARTDDDLAVVYGKAGDYGYVDDLTEDAEIGKEGWESGPEERTTRERDPDDAYDRMRQDKLDDETKTRKVYYVYDGKSRKAVSKRFDNVDDALAARKSLPNAADCSVQTANIIVKENDLVNELAINTNKAKPGQTADMKFNGWNIRYQLKPKQGSGEFKGMAVHSQSAKTPPINAVGTSADDVIAQIKSKIVSNKGQSVISASSVMVDFNVLVTRDIVGHNDIIYGDIISHNGVPTLLISATNEGGMQRAMDRRSNANKTEGTTGQHAFSLSGKKAQAAGLTHARYTLGEPENYMAGVTAYPLEFNSEVHPGEVVKLSSPGVTIAYPSKSSSSIAQESAPTGPAVAWDRSAKKHETLAKRARDAGDEEKAKEEDANARFYRNKMQSHNGKVRPKQV